MLQQGFQLLDGWVVTTEFFLVAIENEENKECCVGKRFPCRDRG